MKLFFMWELLAGIFEFSCAFSIFIVNLCYVCSLRRDKIIRKIVGSVLNYDLYVLGFCKWHHIPSRKICNDHFVLWKLFGEQLTGFPMHLCCPPPLVT